MNEEFIVINGKAYTDYGIHDGRYYLISYTDSSIGEGYVLNSEITHFKEYRKYIPKDQIEQIYSIEDSVLMNGEHFTIFQRSDANYDQPNSWVTLVTDDAEFLKRNHLWEGAEIVENRYNHAYYKTPKISVEDVTILRSRKKRPIR